MGEDTVEIAFKQAVFSYSKNSNICFLLIKIAEINMFIKGINHNRFRGYAEK